MKIILAVLLFAGTFMRSSAAVVKWTMTPAGVAVAEGGGADLNKAMDDRIAKLKGVSLCAEPLPACIAKKTALVAIAFADIGAIERVKSGTSFVGRHAFPGGSDFALVTFPRDVALTPYAFVEVVGKFAGKKQVTAVNGSKVLMPVIEARVIGVLEDGEWQNGKLAFTPDSTMRIYDRDVVKKTAK